MFLSLLIFLYTYCLVSPIELDISPYEYPSIFISIIFLSFSVIVERAHLAQARNDGRKLFENVVNVLVGVLVGEGKTERAVCLFVRQTDREKNVRRLKRCRRAGGSGRSGDSCHVEEKYQAFAFDKLECNV